MYDVSEDITLDKNIKHNIEILVDRLVVTEGIEKRLTESLEQALAEGNSLVYVEVQRPKQEGDGAPQGAPQPETLHFSEHFACPDCGISIEEIEPRSFSFNNPFGACPECTGLGYRMEFDVDLMIPDRSLSIDDGAIVVMGWQSAKEKGSFTRSILDALAEEYHFRLDTPFEQYPQEIQDVLIHGTGGKEVKVHYKGQRGEGVYDVAFEGLIRNVERRYRETFSEPSKAEYETFMRFTPCRLCKGQRLKQSSLAVTVGEKNIYQMTDMSVGKLQTFLQNLQLTKQQGRCQKHQE